MTAPFDVLLITWNGREDTLAALESLERERSSTGFGVVLVDNGSTDGTLDAVRRRFPSVRVIRLDRNRGFTGGITEGVKACSTPWVAFLNNDAVVEPGWAAALAAAAANAPPDVISIAGRILSFDGERIDFVQGHMTFDGHGFQRGFGRPTGSVPELERGAEMLFACGGNMLVRREPFVGLGGFDDDYFAYLEDVDFGWRSWIAGWRTIWEPGATVRHHSSATSRRLGDFERGVLFERNAAQTVLKNFESDLAAEALCLPLLTMLHRQHRYVMDRNAGTAPLRRAPFGERSPERGHAGLRMRLVRWLMRDPEAVVIRDPLTRMQFRATEWIFTNLEKIAQKRAAVQALRVMPDREIFSRFPLLVIPTYHGDEVLFGSPLFDALRSSLSLEEAALGDMIRR